MTFSFRPAVREQVNLLIGIAGPSSSGKTFSALRVATGLAEGGPIFAIDTEGRRALHYADQFQFQHAELSAPFTPERYTEAIKAAHAAGAKVIIVDSMSHEHEGPGGILDQHEQELDRMAGQDWQKRERVKFAAWIKPKASHNRFVNTVLQIPVHMIFCFRAKDKLAMVKDPKTGKVEPVSVGWQPICSDRFEYEMTAMLVLPAGSEGRPDPAAQAKKIQEQHRHFFPAGQQLSEETGRALAEWARGGAAAPPKTGATATGPIDVEKVQKTARDIATMGAERFRLHWKTLSRDERALLKPLLPELEKAAKDADASAARGGTE